MPEFMDFYDGDGCLHQATGRGRFVIVIQHEDKPAERLASDDLVIIYSRTKFAKDNYLAYEVYEVNIETGDLIEIMDANWMANHV